MFVIGEVKYTKTEANHKECPYNFGDVLRLVQPICILVGFYFFLSFQTSLHTRRDYWG